MKFWPSHLRSGKSAETRAEEYLTQQGLSCLTRNYRCRVGEIDLVMRDGACLVFVEVRYRKNRNYGGAIESITVSKQAKIKRAAEIYMQKHPKQNYQSCRFDVVAASGDTDNLKMDWLINAFE